MRFGIIIVAAAALLLAPPVRANELIFRGSVHKALGDATLSIDSRDRLVVDDIGSSGLDGVRIEVGPAEFVELDLTPQPLGLPVGARQSFSAIGQVLGVPDVTAGAIEFARTPNGVSVSATFAGLGAPPRLVEVYAAGNLLTVVTVTSPVAATVLSDAWPTAVTVWRDAPGSNRPAFGARWSTPVALELAGGAFATGDEVRVVVISANNDLGFVTEIEGTGSDVPELFVEDEAIDPDCEGDVDGDGDVDLSDLGIVLANFGATENVSAADGDLDRDGAVGLSDLGILLAVFNLPCD